MKKDTRRGGKFKKTIEDEKEDASTQDIDKVKVSKSMVFKRGKTNHGIKKLVKDFRLVMEPNTATSLKESNQNTIKDFVNAAGILGVSHLISLSNTDTASYISFGRLPNGPTTTFKINSYSLVRDVTRAKVKSSFFEKEFLNSPLVVLNGFGKGTPQLEMVTNMVQSMFPAINVFTLKLSSCKRVVLFNYDKEQNQIEFRHYAIKVTTFGLNKSIKRVIQCKVPNISNLNDISDYVLNGLGASESDFEESGDGPVEVNNVNSADGSTKKVIKLDEIGPRMNLTLIKVEEDLFKGSVLFHEYVTKTDEEKLQLELNQKEKKIEKERRKKEQESNVKKKKDSKDLKKENKKRKLQQLKDRDDDDEDDYEYKENKFSDDDDEKYFRKETGQEPDNSFKSDNNEKRHKKKFKPSKSSSK